MLRVALVTGGTGGLGEAILYQAGGTRLPGRDDLQPWQHEGA